MDLYLIRHADALALGEGGTREDAQRPLSKKGEKQARAVGKELKGRGIVLETIVTSPLVRARQTAEIILANLPLPAPGLEICEFLAPDGKLKMLAQFLQNLGKASPVKGGVALVGHMPHLANLAGWFIGKKDAQIDFAKAGIAYIYCPEIPGKGGGILHFLVTPDWFGK